MSNEEREKSKVDWSRLDRGRERSFTVDQMEYILKLEEEGHSLYSLAGKIGVDCRTIYSRVKLYKMRKDELLTEAAQLVDAEMFLCDGGPWFKQFQERMGC